MPDTRKAYVAAPRGERFEVLDGNGRVILTCSDQASAEHYAVLLSQAWESGFKAAATERRNKTTPGG